MDDRDIATREVSVNIAIPPHSLSGIYYIPKKMVALIVLSHGAGAGMTHAFMEGLASTLANNDIGTLRFNLPYMEAGKKMPGSPKHAMEGIQQAADQAHKDHPDTPIFLAGKSYGGRMSSQLMSAYPVPYVKGVIFYGFPLHAPGRPSTDRADHLKDVQAPMLFLQGMNDKLATPDLLSPRARELDKAHIEFFEHADHSFKRPKRVTQDSLIPELSRLSKEWLMRVLSKN